VAIAEAARQRRGTVAIRTILVIPHLFVLYFLQIAAGLIAFIGWWGALFTGRLPDFAASYLEGYVRWSARVSAYMFLLTDVYPPFSLDDEPTYPVRVAITPGQPLNRLAVLFRCVLAIPAYIVIVVVTLGTGTIVSFVAWLVTLVAGELPASLHLAFTAVLRYLIRFNCYWLMLTPAYPSGLFGDAPAYGTPPGYGATPGYGTAPGYGMPSGYDATPGYQAPPEYGVPGYGTPGGYGSPGGYGVPAGYGAARPVFEPASWQLILTPVARRLVVLFVVLGSLFWALYGVLIAALVHQGGGFSSTVALDELNSSYSTLSRNLNQWQATVAACDKNLTCVTKADGKAATYFSSFAGKLQVVRAMPVPPAASAAAARLDSDATRAAQDFTELSHATTVAQYQYTFKSSGLQQALNSFDQDYNTLGTALENS
jgi:hypothetical protein